MKNPFRLTVLLVFSSCHVMATDDEHYAAYSLLATSAVEDRAVLKSPDGTMLLLKAGTFVEAVNAEVLHVLDDRVVFKENHDYGDQVIIYLRGTRSPEYQRITARVPAASPSESVIFTGSIPIDSEPN